jgi:guanine nucleotide-binding protein G(o) subunit alpha
MGICSSRQKQWEQILAEERARSRELERSMSIDMKKEQQIHKLLLLGAGESGKSTIFKQMKGIYGGGWGEEERKSYTMIVYSNIISSLKTLIEMSFALKEHGAEGTDIKAENLPAVQSLRHLEDNTEIDEKMAANIHQVWWDPGVQRTWDYRSMYYLTDSAAYFLDKVLEVGRATYVPSEQDVLRSRVRTTGIVENSFIVDGNHFKIYDVGGQRNERKKWIHCFSEVTAVLFVAALSEYDMVLYEDQDTNRMQEALDLFEEICNSRYFKKTAMILFLNKRDLFFEKIQQVPLTVCFPEYKDINDYEHGAAFIEAQFQARNKQPKKVYTHMTCATDTSNVQAVFNAVKDIVVSDSLKDAQLLT